MSYTPTSWSTGDTITATAMNKIENGIANAGGSSWDAVIRLTHADSSGPDNTSNVTPSIVSGTYADLSAKIGNNGFPRILVEYKHPWGMQFAVPMAYISSCDSEAIILLINGYSFVNDDNTMSFTLEWTLSDTLNFF